MSIEAVPRTNTTAVVSLVFGILAWTVLPLVGSIVAIVAGHMARSELARLPPGSESGDGIALAGLILGWVQLALVLAGLVAVIVFFGGLAALLTVLAAVG